MKNIELTEDHKSKLLEMCKVLFPIIFTPTIEENGYINYSDTGKTINYKDRFHWFEFCVLNLATELYNLNKRNEISKIELYRGDLIQNYHPIDYLYDEYQYYIKTK